MPRYIGLGQEGFPDPNTAGQGRGAQAPQNPQAQDNAQWKTGNQNFLQSNPYTIDGSAQQGNLLGAAKALNW